MKVVRFVRNWSPYNTGEIAGFEDDVAFRLCNGANPITVEVGMPDRVVDVPAPMIDVPTPVTAAPVMAPAGLVEVPPGVAGEPADEEREAPEPPAAGAPRRKGARK